MRENLAYEEDNFSSNDDNLDISEQAPEILVTTDGVRDYLKNIGRVSLLNAQQEVELARQSEAGAIAGGVLEAYREGDDELVRRLAESHGLTSDELTIDLQTLTTQGERARQHMVQANLRLVVSIAKRYRLSGMEFLDLVSEGNAGLVHAVDMFDYTKGFKFSTYATWWIRQAITRAIADKSRTVRIPVHMHEKMMKMVKTKSQMLAELGRMPTDEELAVELDMTVEKVQLMQRQNQSTISLDTPIGEDSEVTFGDLLQEENTASPTEVIFGGQLAKALETRLGSLTVREAEVIKYRFGLGRNMPMTLDEIGGLLGLTRERIRQIQKKAMEKLRNDPGILNTFREGLE